ncbi:hypothetical protein BD410DRAFT_774933 [Rickenella mellea]|uniref:Flavin-nucleotide-binding protein n=1 Tax=Rickenella mellea TaxID=50990 RepID=A0A4Y7PSY2_9AGAM|nr:hypothetical protein BD410DRAFT_774933 [Rickenella mellea]
MADDGLDSKFDQSNLNTVKRNKDRASYDKQQIADIFKQAKICHVSFIHDFLPQCIPMIAAVEETDEGELFVYFHGYPRARFIQSLLESGTPMTATATILDGYVLALSVFHHSMNYRSAVLYGVSMPFDDNDTEAKMRALKLVVDSTTPGRWENARQPNDAELKGTGIIRMKVDTGSAKIRTGGPKDDRKDIEDTKLVSETWTGVVPISAVAGEPKPTNYAPASIPEHIRNLR